MSVRKAYSRAERPSNPPTGPAARLAQARGVIEGKFLDLGKVLETSVEVVGGLIGGIDDLAKVLDEGAVEQATANLTHAAAQLNGLSEGRGDHRAGFQSVAEATLKLGAHIEAMQQALRYLHVFAVNIKVTAGGVPGASVVFADFAEEVLAAIAEGRSELAEFHRELDALRGQVSDALALEAELDRRCAELLPATPQRLAADAATLADHHRKVAATTAEVGAIARSLQGKVGGALCSLQIGDTTRQRAEHVEDGLAMAAAARADRGLGEAGEATIRAMLAAQLDDTAEIFNRDMDKMAASLAGVAADAREVLRLRAVTRGGQGGKGDQGGGVLARLEASLADTMSLVRDLESAEASAQGLRRSAEETAAGLGRRINSIRRIRANINQMALNAHLKCVRLGDPGRPLSVIAVELRVSADDLGDRAGQAEQILARLSQASVADAPAGALGTAAVGELLDAAVAPIRAAETKAGADLAALAERSEGMIAQLRQATDRLDFHGAVSDVMSRVASEIAAVAPPPADDPVFAEVMAEIARLYTMARERQVHKRFEPPEAAKAAA